MPRITVTVPHELGQEQAAGRLATYLDMIREKNKDKIKDFEQTLGENSGTFSFKTMGFKVAGDVAVHPADVTLNCDLPFAAMLFKGKIEKEMREQLERVLRA